MRIVFMGTPDFAVESLSSLIKAGHDISAVVTAPDKPAGRGLELKESAVKQFAKNNSIRVLQPLKLKDPDFRNELIKINADLFVVVAFRMLPEDIWSLPPMGTINLHASLLPQYRGAAPINWAIINGEEITGATTFFINNEIDKGKIIYFEKEPISKTMTAGDLHDILMKKGAELLVKTVNDIENKCIETISQDELIIPDEELKTAPKLSREICKIDWNHKVEGIYNQIRGLNPYPAAWTTFFNNEKNEAVDIKLFSCEIIDGRHNSNYGKIISDNKEYLYITADGGLINVLELQPQGKKRMFINDFLKGFRNADSWQIKM